ncbi:uncharacterized protein LOC101860479 [Aplysia californica]|uniref:Glycine N-acyltransferase-like protein n=1 Tax=Aplysia californica TaxID=6500 RepID=A0ABM1VNP0_APLCA|nr:uncharacterized protein LOC101860479 [Aplysia californica]
MSVMYRTLTAEESQDLRWELHSSLPGSAKIYYVLSNHMDNLLTGFEVIVDQWPNWTCIMLRPKSFESVPRYFRHYHMCHTKSTKDFKFFIQRPCVVDWTKPAIFTGIPYDVVPVIQDKSRKEYGEVTSVEHRFMYAWTKSDPPEPAVAPEGMQLTELKKEHAEMIRDHWKHYRANDGLVEYFQQVIEQFDNSAITTTDGELVAYICMQYNGSMANLFVDPAYHTANLGVLLLRDLTRKLLEKHQTAYGFIKTKDSAFITTCQNIGFSWVPQGSMSWVNHKPRVPGSRSPLAKVPSANGLSTSQEEKDKQDGGDSELEVKDLFLTALPLSCNKCSGIPEEKRKGACIHVGTS